VDKRLRELGVTRPFLLYVGSIQPRKNLARLVEAFRALGRDDLSLAIAGQTAWCTNKSLPFEVEGVSDLLLLGYVASDDLQVLYNSAEAFVFPSLFEGFGMPVLEAMACGCPVVTSRTSSLPEVAGDAAVFVDPTDVESIRDGIQEALSTSRRPELVQRGLERAAVFTWDATASLTLATIRAAYGG
jgi:glycosyltransferase involved in cell wall biosynthesis